MYSRTPFICSSLSLNKSMIIDVEATLFPRVDLTKVGLAPASSMFFFGPNDRTNFDDYRPEVHDSDGLLMINGRGAGIRRQIASA